MQETELFAAALGQALDAVLITDADLTSPGPNILYANAAFCRLTGYSVEELVGRSPRLLQGPRTDRAVLDDLRLKLERGHPLRRQHDQLPQGRHAARHAVARLANHVARREDHAVLVAAPGPYGRAAVASEDRALRKRSAGRKGQGRCEEPRAGSVKCAPAFAGDDRRADRPEEPPPLSPGTQPQPGFARRGVAGDAGRRPLQIVQRHVRALGRRRCAASGGRGVEVMHAERRHRGPLRR